MISKNNALVTTFSNSQKKLNAELEADFGKSVAQAMANELNTSPTSTAEIRIIAAILKCYRNITIFNYASPTSVLILKGDIYNGTV